MEPSVTCAATGRSCKLEQLCVSGSKIIKPFAKRKRKIQGAGGGRTPTGKDMVWLQHCSIFKSWVLTSSLLPWLYLLHWAGRQCLDTLSVQPCCYQLVAGVQQQCFAAKTSPVLPKSPVQEAPFTHWEVQLSSYWMGSFVYDASVNEVLRPCKIFLKREGVTLGGEEDSQEILGKLSLAFASP